MSSKKRLEGLDLARFCAFVGMVLVNFRIVLIPEANQSAFVNFFEGKAAALFVVLAGVGLGLAFAKNKLSYTVILKRAAFLMILGLLNSLIFPADIIHYYAVYFALGCWLLPLSKRGLILAIIVVVMVSFTGLLALNYDAGWDWKTLEYEGFWTPEGFIRNLFYNGWHPVFPWIAFLLYGMWLSKIDIVTHARNLAVYGFIICTALIMISGFISPILNEVETDLGLLTGVAPVPPTPFYVAVGMSGATSAIGICELLFKLDWMKPLLSLMSKAGRISLTLYIAHIVIGMGMFEELGWIGALTENQSIAASLIFCALSMLFATLWMRVYKAGPLELLMRKIAG